MAGLQVGNVDLGGVLDGYDGVSASGGGKYVEPGEYIVECQQIEFKNGFKGITFIGTNKVLKVLKQVTDENGLVISNAEGDEANLVEPLSDPKKKPIAQSNIKAYMLALAGSKFAGQQIDPAKVNSKEFLAACAGPAQPLKKVLVHVSAFHKPKTKGEGNVTVKNWRAMTNAELEPFGLKQP